MTPMERLLLDLFKAQGAADAAGLARKAAESFDLDQRDKHIYELRSTITEETLAGRFGVSPRRVRQIIRTQIRLKKVG